MELARHRFARVRVVPALLLALVGARPVVGQEPPAPRLVELTAPDGTQLKATYFGANRPGPGVLLLHQCNRQRSTWDNLAGRLASAGLNVLTLDYRGFGESEGARFTELPLQEQPAPPASDLFRYDDTVKLTVQQVGSARHGDVSVLDIVFNGTSDPIRAYLVRPAGKGPFAGILYIHWLGDPSTTNRTQYLDEAIALAPKGAVALLIDGMWAQPGWYKARVPEEDFKASVRQVIDLRRALDLLLSQPDVDAKRIGYVGHDFGAMYGVVMGAVDSRPKTYVLGAGTIRFSDWYLFADKPKDLAAYKEKMSALDPIGFVGSLGRASVFFQFAGSDEFVPSDDALAFYRAARPRKQMTTYDTDHSLKGSDVQSDRLSWLVKELDLRR